MTIKLTDFAWRRALDEVEAARTEHAGDLPVSIRKGIAARLNVTDRHLRRLLDKQDVHEGNRGLTDEQLAYLAMKGTVSEAYRAIVRDGNFVGSVSTFRRRVEAAGRALYLGIVYGEEEMRDSYVYLRWEAAAPNAVWQQDSAWAHVAVLHRGGPVHPSVEFILDDNSRLLTGIAVKPWAPDGALATRTLATAMRGQLTPGGRQAKPTIVRHDQAAYYIGKHYTEAVSDARINDKAVRGRAPYLKGKVERVIRTARVECLNQMPGSFHVPKALGEDEAKLRHDVRDRLLSLDEFTERLVHWGRWYNEERPHGALGRRTPAEVWIAGAKPSTVQESDIVALLRQPTEVRVVSKNGIHWQNRDFTHPALNGMAGHGFEVQVGPDPDDPDALHVYRERLWLCTARPHAYWNDHMEEFFEARGSQEKRARGIRALASALRSDGVPSAGDRASEDYEARYEAMLGDKELSA